MGWTDARRWDWSTIALWVPVVAVVALTQLGFGLEEPWTGSDLTLAVIGLLLAAPLILRRTLPLGCAVLVALALVVQEAIGGSLGFASFVTVLVTAYSVGRYLPVRLAVLGGATVLTGALVAMRVELAESPTEAMYPLFYVAAAVALGSVVRRQARQAHRLQRLNDALAAEHEASARLAVATERMRLARDLHDTVAHTLTVMVVQAENCEAALTDDDPARARAAARAVQEAGRRGLGELRSTVRVLRDSDEHVAPGLGDLETLAGVMEGAGVAVEVRRRGDLGAVPDDVGRELTRVAQEALTNVVKHSAAVSADLEVVVTPDGVTTTVVDAGPPLENGLSSGGHGLLGMRERLAAYGGTVAAGPCGPGYRVEAHVPLGRAGAR
jgi:signal transduction histidine kinase